MQASQPIWSQDSNLAIIADGRSKLNSRRRLHTITNDDAGLLLRELSTLELQDLDAALEQSVDCFELC